MTKQNNTHCPKPLSAEERWQYVRDTFNPFEQKTLDRLIELHILNKNQMTHDNWTTNGDLFATIAALTAELASVREENGHHLKTNSLLVNVCKRLRGENERLRAALLNLTSIAVAVQQENTPEFMEYLAEAIQKAEDLLEGKVLAQPSEYGEEAGK